MGLDQSLYKVNKVFKNLEEMKEFMNYNDILNDEDTKYHYENIAEANQLSDEEIFEMRKHCYEYRESYKNILAKELNIQTGIIQGSIEEITMLNKLFEEEIKNEEDDNRINIDESTKIALENAKIKFIAKMKKNATDAENKINHANENKELYGSLIKEELAYWRKHSDLQGYMEKLYAEKGGKDTFNCIPLILTKEDVEKLVKAHEENSIEEARGFFWGISTDNHFDNSLKVFKKVLEETDFTKESIYYSCWW